MRIMRSNDGNCGITEHWSLLTHMDACVDTGYILGTNSCIGTEDTGISLVQTNSITSKSS